MHVPAVPLFRDATGMAVALTAWACHRCLQLYLGPKPVRRRALLVRAQASKAQGPIDFLRILFLGPKPVRRRALLFSKGLLGPKPVRRRALLFF